MISKEHKKHTDLKRPSYGFFGRNEWAITGTQCNTIKSLADTIIKALSPSFKAAYVDAEHLSPDIRTNRPGRLAAGAVAEYTEHVSYHQFNYSRSFNPFHWRQQFNETDLVLINGNHYQGKKQVVIIDEIKKESLQKRITQLTYVDLFLLADNTIDLFDFIKAQIPDWQNIPVYALSEKEKIIQFFKNKMDEVLPVINGLVLAGGKSSRMGTDKGTLKLHKKEQRYHQADMLKEFCREVYISCRAEQAEEIDISYKIITDSFMGLGPYGAILSAFREQPDAAWLVTACDLPLLHPGSIAYLIGNRNSSEMATAYKSPFDSLPEPLMTLWEPKSYPILLSFLAQGYSCPRKVLINNEIRLLEPPDPAALTNVNTMEELLVVKEKLQQNKAIK